MISTIKLFCLLEPPMGVFSSVTQTPLLTFFDREYQPSFLISVLRNMRILHDRSSTQALPFPIESSYMIMSYPFNLAGTLSYCVFPIDFRGQPACAWSAHIAPYVFIRRSHYNDIVSCNFWVQTSLLLGTQQSHESETSPASPSPSK